MSGSSGGPKSDLIRPDLVGDLLEEAAPVRPSHAPHLEPLPIPVPARPSVPSPPPPAPPPRPSAPPPLGRASVPPLPSARGSAPAPGLPLPKHPSSPTVARWLGLLVRAQRGVRLYADNNATLREYLDDCARVLEELLLQVGTLRLEVRPDRLLHGDDVVFVNPDREGLPQLLHKSAIRCLEIDRGVDRDEVHRLVGVLSIDFSRREHAGEDLSSALWRARLPHVRAVAADAMVSDFARVRVPARPIAGARSSAEASWSESGGADGATVARDVAELEERIRGKVARAVAALSEDEVGGGDLSGGLVVPPEDVAAIEALWQEAPGAADLLGLARVTFSRRGAAAGAAALVAALERQDAKESLAARLLELLFDALHREGRDRPGVEPSPPALLLVEMFDALLLARRFYDASKIIHRVKKRAGEARGEQGRSLLALLTSPERIRHLMAGLNASPKAVNTSELGELIRALAPHASTALIDSVGALEHPSHRKAVCELLAETGEIDTARVMEKLSPGARWDVAVDLLSLAQGLPPARSAPLIIRALSHDSAKVRAGAVTMLRSFPPGGADQLIARQLHDPDHDVRLATIRVAVTRNDSSIIHSLETILGREDLQDRDPIELKMLMTAYANVAGPRSVPLLAKILNPGILTLKKAPDAQIAAALALGKVAGHEAADALRKGTRSLNRLVRHASERALAQHSDEVVEEISDDLLEASADLEHRPTPEELALERARVDREEQEQSEVLDTLTAIMRLPPRRKSAVSGVDPLHDAFAMDGEDPFAADEVKTELIEALGGVAGLPGSSAGLRAPITPLTSTSAVPADFLRHMESEVSSPTEPLALPGSTVLGRGEPGRPSTPGSAALRASGLHKDRDKGGR